MQDIMDIQAADTLLDYRPICDLSVASLASHHDTDDVADMSLDDESDAIEDFPHRLLRALATMAVRSKRRQADLAAALCRGGLEGEAGDVGPALQALERSGFIEQIVPLYDGGVLMSVTSRGIEQLSTLPRWAMLDGAMRLG